MKSFILIRGLTVLQDVVQREFKMCTKITDNYKNNGDGTKCMVRYTVRLQGILLSIEKLLQLLLII